MDNEQLRVKRTGTQAGVGGVVTAIVGVLVAWGISKGVEIPEQVTDVVTTEMLIPGAIALVGLAMGVGTRITTSLVERLSARWPWIARLNGPEGTPTYIEQAPGEAISKAFGIIVDDVAAKLKEFGDEFEATRREMAAAAKPDPTGGITFDEAATNLATHLPLATGFTVQADQLDPDIRDMIADAEMARGTWAKHQATEVDSDD